MPNHEKAGKLNPSIPGSHTSITNLGNNAKSNESNNAARIMKAEYWLVQGALIRSSWFIKPLTKNWRDSTPTIMKSLEEMSCLSGQLFLLTRKCFAKHS